ncbi:hypothetical protein IW261DRAFT_1427863 [Armillaria novae-zelandiae]|uniref:Uncharacterized protein n=1 Tax=Armillaria novae-zelandiae TaxID=153914 RepID=A0AA39NCZ2_9AGAR|nr:hypothetical protein IW261DRAFT_1427863 [Armillaria novae-zelandiae]
MTYSHMSRPKKYHTQEARLQAIRENSNRYYTKHRHDISARRKLAYQTKSSHHVGPEMAPKVPPPPDPFPKFNAEVLKILQQFEDFLVSKTPSDYVKSLLRCYFKDSSRRQGEIGLFVEPLDVLYKMQEAHRSISMQALQADGPSKRQKRLDCAGNGIGTLISWLEDIWRAGIDGSLPASLPSAVKNTAVAFGAVSGYAFLVELIDSIGMKFERARLRSSKNDQQADNIGMLEIPGVAATTTSVVCYSTPLGTFHSDHLKRSKSPRVGNITKEQREFLRPYIAYYRRLKDRAREHPKPYSIFQSRLWLLWKDRFRSQLQPPDLADKSAREHWYTCRQKDLATIIRILEMWEPFYTAGHVCKIAQRARVKAKVAKAAKKRDSRREVVSGEQIRRSERMPKPRKLVDNAEGDLL